MNWGVQPQPPPGNSNPALGVYPKSSGAQVGLWTTENFGGMGHMTPLRIGLLLCYTDFQKTTPLVFDRVTFVGCPNDIWTVRIWIVVMAGGGGLDNFAERLGLGLRLWFCCCVTFAESEPYCHSILFVCLDVCRSFRDLPTTIDRSQPNLVGRYIYTCPRTRVSLFGSLSPILSVPEGKICKISPISKRT